MKTRNKASDRLMPGEAASLIDIAVPFVAWTNTGMANYSSKKYLKRTSLEASHYFGDAGGDIIDFEGRHFKIVSFGRKKPAEPIWWTFLVYWSFRPRMLRELQTWRIEIELEYLGQLSFEETKEKLLSVFESHKRWKYQSHTHKESAKYLREANNRAELYQRAVFY